MNWQIEDLYGEWQALTGVLGGADLPADVVAATKLTIAEGSRLFAHVYLDQAGSGAGF